MTASKCKSVFTRQETLDKKSVENAKNLVEKIGLGKSCPPPIQEERKPRNAREWGLLHKKSARKAYQGVASHSSQAKADPERLLISPSKPFFSAMWAMYSALMVALMVAQ